MPARNDQKRDEILAFIKEKTLKKGYPPTIREICEAVHLKSTASVHSYLDSLEREGKIRRDPAKPRTIEIVDDEFGLMDRELANIPVVGDIAAGLPLLAQQNITGYFPFPADMLPSEEVFLLNVRGDSMIGMGILDGDALLCRKASTAVNGEVVVALVDDSATVKRFFREDGHIRLQPENDEMEPIIVEDCRVIGKPFALLRMNL